MSAEAPPAEAVAWHTLAAGEVLARLRTSSTGLTSADARQRLAAQGYNELQTAAHRSAWRTLAAQFRNVLVVILLVATLLSALVGHALEAVVIVVIVLFAVLLGFVQEYRAERALEALREIAVPTGHALRDGIEVALPARELVPGDVIQLRAGDRVPADARVTPAANLSIDDASVLTALNRWSTATEIRQATALSTSTVASAIRRLRAAQLIEASDEPRLPRRRAMDHWRVWNPEAGLFHFGTQNGEPEPAPVTRQRLDDLLTLGMTPPSRRRRSRGAVTRLPAASTRSALARVLLERRTWRRFAADPLTLPHLATLFGLTWGVQRWARFRSTLHAPLKTSPSGGACHSLEVYVAVQNVRGLGRGIYRYDADTHALVRVRRHLPVNGVDRWIRQPELTGCAAAFFVTSVWPRVQWKYPFSRAYRVVLLEAGHFVQTFCLVATSLGLAPFCTGAFDDAALERALGIDGIAEGVIYAAGVGTRPPETQWARWPDAAWTPSTYPPAWRRKSSK